MKDGHVSDEHLQEIIECGIRVQDHAALNPWRLVIIGVMPEKYLVSLFKDQSFLLIIKTQKKMKLYVKQTDF